MKTVTTTAFVALALFGIPGIQSGAADFAAKKQVVSLMADWPLTEQDVFNELNTLHVPKKLQISSLEMESDLRGRTLVLQVTEFNGKKRTDFTLTTKPKLRVIKTDNGAESLQVEALLAPSGMGQGDGITVDSSAEELSYYYLLNFDTDEKFSYVHNLSLSFNKNIHSALRLPEKVEMVKYEITPLQGEFDFADLIPLPRVINSEVVLGEKELKLGYRFTRPSLDRSVSRELNAMGVPEVLDLPSVKVAAGLLGTQLHLPFTDVTRNEARPLAIAGTSLFEVSPTTKLPIKFSHDLAPTFDFASGSADVSNSKYVLTLEFYTDEGFTRVSDVKLVLVQITRGVGEASGPVREEVAKYDLEQVEYQLPIYPGDDR